MPPQIRLNLVEKIFTANLRRKFWAGNDKFRGTDEDIETMSPLQVLYNLRDELVDSVVYLETAIDKLEKNEAKKE
jgi:hypothetical protein